MRHGLGSTSLFPGQPFHLVSIGLATRNIIQAKNDLPIMIACFF
jgi:hypothetical protein